MDVAVARLTDARLELQQAEARADLFGFLASLLNEVPSLTLVRQLRTLGVEAFALAAQAGGTQPGVADAVNEIAAFVEATRALPETEVQQQLAVDWTRLFRGVSPTYGPVPPYESLYTDGPRTQLEILQTIQSLYVENGAALAGRAPDRPDYLGLELGFVSFLARQEAAAWRQGASDLAANLAALGQDFLVQHPARWVARFVDAAIAQSQTSFYRGLLHLAQAALAEAASAAP
jgi:TorA maturation chaperone TorD